MVYGMHLIVTIFYNDVIFETVLKALRTQGLSVFRWLELISDTTMESKVKGLFDDFRKHTDSELWKSRTDLEAFIQKPGVIERYMNGEIGFNLLYTFKSLAITNYLEGIVEVVTSAISRLLKESNRNEDIELVKAHFGEEEMTKKGWNLVEAPAMERGGCDITTAQNAVDVSIERRCRDVIDKFLLNQGLSND